MFKARQFGSDIPRESHASDGPANSAPIPARTELTKNDKYCVSRLPALPPVLRSEAPADRSALLNGYADGKTDFALVVSEHSINVWPYKSADDVPISYEFPLGDSTQDACHLAILTRAGPGASQDPGLVMVNPVSGHVRFYESVQQAPALGMINSKSIETTVPVLAARGEIITLAENVEPAGIVVATSWKRVVLVTLRDHKGAPRLATLELTRPSASLRLLGGWFGHHDDELSDDIVSLKAGAVGSQTQEIVVQDAAGIFRKYTYQSSSTGAPVLNHSLTLLYRLGTYLESNVDGLLPGSLVHAKFLDLWPAFLSASRENTDVYVALVCVQSSLLGCADERLALVTMKINASGVMILGSHLLPPVPAAQTLSVAAKPRLFVPRPGTAPFVVVGNAVVLCDLCYHTAQPTEFFSYRPRWEDTVKFKASVLVVGYGYEDQAGDDNPALLLITADFGVLRVERFLLGDGASTDPPHGPASPQALLRSHIQQAIYYHDSAPMDFSTGANYLADDISAAVDAVTDELRRGASPYLPHFASTRDALAARLRLLRELLAFVRANFESCWPAVYPRVVEVLEKVAVAQKLWHLIDRDNAAARAMKRTLGEIIVRGDFAPRAADVVRAYFGGDVNSVLEVWSQLLDTPGVFSPAALVEALVATLHDAVYAAELAYIVPHPEIGPRRLWLFDSNLVVKADEAVNRVFCAPDASHLQIYKGRDDLVKLTTAMYYLITSAIAYMKSANDEQLAAYTEWFEHRCIAWMDALLLDGMLREALVIAEQYRDYASMTRVLEKERELCSPEYILDKIALYMHDYGYDFACQLFHFLIDHNEVLRLLHDFKAYQDYLTRFFDENPRKTGVFAWTYYVKAKSYEEAAHVLLSVAASDKHDNQQVREFNYSMAKLSALAAGAEDAKLADAYALQELVVEAENSLVVVRIQNKIFHYISLFVQGKSAMVTVNYFLDSFANSKLSRAQLAQELAPFFARFVEQKALTKTQLLALLTAINPIAQLSTVFADAFVVAALICNDHTFRVVAGQVWAKLLVYTDDWSVLTATGDNTDEVNKLKMRETVLYQTLKEVKENAEIMGALDTVLASNATDDVTDKLHALQRKYDVRKWVSIIQAEA